jgi:hypothetical protein
MQNFVNTDSISNEIKLLESVTNLKKKLAAHSKIKNDIDSNLKLLNDLEDKCNNLQHDETESAILSDAEFNATLEELDTLKAITSTQTNDQDLQQLLEAMSIAIKKINGCKRYLEQQKLEVVNV